MTMTAEAIASHAHHFNMMLDLRAKGGDTCLVMDLLMLTDTPADAMHLILQEYDITPPDLRLAYVAARSLRHHDRLYRPGTGLLV